MSGSGHLIRGSTAGLRSEGPLANLEESAAYSDGYLLGQQLAAGAAERGSSEGGRVGAFNRERSAPGLGALLGQGASPAPSGGMLGGQEDLSRAAGAASLAEGAMAARGRRNGLPPSKSAGSWRLPVHEHSDLSNLRNGLENDEVPQAQKRARLQQEYGRPSVPVPAALLDHLREQIDHQKAENARMLQHITHEQHTQHVLRQDMQLISQKLMQLLRDYAGLRQRLKGAQMYVMGTNHPLPTPADGGAARQRMAAPAFGPSQPQAASMFNMPPNTRRPTSVPPQSLPLQQMPRQLTPPPGPSDVDLADAFLDADDLAEMLGAADGSTPAAPSSNAGGFDPLRSLDADELLFFAPSGFEPPAALHPLHMRGAGDGLGRHMMPSVRSMPVLHSYEPTDGG